MDSDIFNPAFSIRAAVRRLKARFQLVKYAIEWARLLKGALIHALRGETPRTAQQALVNLFVMSQGRTNDFLAWVLSIRHSPYVLPQSSGVLGNLTPQDLAKIQEKLEIDGYYVFENCLPADFCERIVRQTLKANCLVLGDEFVAQPEKVYDRYNRESPYAPKYILTEDDTSDIPEVQQLLSDLSLITVAQNYLKSKPIFTGLSLWWSAPVKNSPDANAAQQFHFDMERIRWLRYFIYLTDVTKYSGPHCFIKGSHRSGAIPAALLKPGYVRQTDETILESFGQEAYREFIGPRGTIVAEDSRGFHKGLMPAKGDRLLLAFEISNSTFGANKRHLIRRIHVPQFGELAKKYPRVYANFDFENSLLI
ncbi:MAG: phytanoyl-CoA dioxygenase family protein [Betaproteobacteria bacterium]|nr:phytanoyl-CoA dioxygenase family protein [Betaproteobacteria bacterium]